MKNKDSFFSQYQSPQWQKLRLETLNESGWVCAECGTKDSQLHVHHVRYHKGRKIWEYQPSELLVLCHECHESWHGLKDVLGDLLLDAGKNHIPMSDVVGIVSGYLSARGVETCAAQSVTSFHENLVGLVAGIATMNLHGEKLEEWVAEQIATIEGNAQRRRSSNV